MRAAIVAVTAGLVLTTTLEAGAQDAAPSSPSSPPPVQRVPWKRPPPGQPGSGVPPPPPPAGPVSMVTVDNSPRLMRAGIGLTIAGAIVGPIGIGWFAYQAENPSSGDFAAMDGVFPIFLMSAGGALVATGIPLWIAGEYDIEVPSDSPRGRESLASFELLLGPATTGMSMRF